MKAALLSESLDIQITDVSKPKQDGTNVLVQVRACGVCATDVKKFTGKSSAPYFPFIMGHEPAGIVAQINTNTKSSLKTGDRVAVMPVITCGHCHGCVSGLTASEGMGMCENYEVVGYSSDGAFAEFIHVPERNLVRIPENLSFRDAAIIEPVAACTNGVRKVLKSPPGNAVVLGAGFMGLTCLALLKLLGARVLIADLMDERLEIAKELGADAVINSGREDLETAVRAFTNGRGAESVICAVGSKALTETGLRLLAKAGRIVLLASGEKGTKIEFDLNETHYFHPVITGAVSFTTEQFLWTMDLLADNRINTDLLVTHTGELEKVQNFLEMTRDRVGLKKVILMGGE